MIATYSRHISVCIIYCFLPPKLYTRIVCKDVLVCPVNCKYIELYVIKRFLEYSGNEGADLEPGGETLAEEEWQRHVCVVHMFNCLRKKKNIYACANSKLRHRFCHTAISMCPLIYMQNQNSFFFLPLLIWLYASYF